MQTDYRLLKNDLTVCFSSTNICKHFKGLEQKTPKFVGMPYSTRNLSGVSSDHDNIPKTGRHLSAIRTIVSYPPCCIPQGYNGRGLCQAYLFDFFYIDLVLIFSRIFGNLQLVSPILREAASCCWYLRYVWVYPTVDSCFCPSLHRMALSTSYTSFHGFRLISSLHLLF